MAFDVAPLEICHSQPVAVWLTLTGTVREAGVTLLLVKETCWMHENSSMGAWASQLAGVEACEDMSFWVRRENQRRSMERTVLVMSRCSPRLQQ